MRKYQVEQAFEAFSNGYLLLTQKPSVYGGVKSPRVDFKIAGVSFTYLAAKNAVYKAQARDSLVFDDSKAVLAYVKKMEAMKMNDPLYRGARDQ